MPTPIPEPAAFVVSGNMVIQFLAASLFLVAGALVAVIVYVFRGLAKEIERLANRIDSLADSLGGRIDGLADSLGGRIDRLTERMDKLTERIDKLADTLHGEIAAVREDVYHRLEQTREHAS